jgi:hypothetical protein
MPNFVHIKSTDKRFELIKHFMGRNKKQDKLHNKKYTQTVRNDLQFQSK